MPELPEVQTTVNGLNKKVLSRAFVNVWSDWEKLLKKPADFNSFKKQIKNKKIVKIYRRAKNMDPTVTQAQERISALSGSVPSQEDYFFRGLKSGQSIPIIGNCYGWIGKSITVP